MPPKSSDDEDDDTSSDESVHKNETSIRPKDNKKGKGRAGSTNQHERLRRGRKPQKTKRGASRKCTRATETREDIREPEKEAEEAVVNGKKRAKEAETMEEFMVEARSIGVVSSVSDVTVAVTATIKRCWRLKKFIFDDKEIEPGGRIMRWICKEMRIGGSRKQRATWWNENMHKKLVKEKFNQYRNSATNGIKKRIVGKCASLEVGVRISEDSPCEPLLLSSVEGVVRKGRAATRVQTR